MSPDELIRCCLMFRESFTFSSMLFKNSFDNLTSNFFKANFSIQRLCCSYMGPVFIVSEVDKFVVVGTHKSGVRMAHRYNRQAVGHFADLLKLS